MNLSDKKTAIIIIIGFLWMTITVLGWKGYYMAGMYLGVLLMLLHMMLGTAKQGKLSLKMFIYPLCIWGVLWCMSFGLSKFYADMFTGTIPDFKILGLHPSFAWTVITYWLGGVATLTLGFIVFKDEWLSEKDWKKFKEKIQAIEQSGGEINVK